MFNIYYMKKNYRKIWKEIYGEISFLIVSTVLMILSVIFDWCLIFPLSLIVFLVVLDEFLEKALVLRRFFRLFDELQKLPPEKVADWLVMDADEDERIIFLWFIQSSSRTEIVMQLYERVFYYQRKCPEKYHEVIKMFLP